jgi:hypothetical protein
LGGPLWGHKTFFFASYEGLRLRLPQAIETAVPSLALRQAAAPSIQPLVNAFPLPNGPDLGGGAAQFTGSFSDPSSIDSASLRVDHTFSSKLSAFARYSYAPSTVVSRAWQGPSNNVLSNPSKLKLTNHSITAGLTQVFSNTITNEIRFNYSHTKSRNDISLDNYAGAVPPNATDLFPSFASPSDSTFGAFFLGMGVWDFGKLAENLQRQVNVVDNVSLAKGAHQLKVGIDYRRLSPVSQPLRYMLQPDFFGEPDITSGVPSETDLSAAAPSVVLVSTNFSAYGQDTWRASSRISLTFGLRWDVNPPFHGGDGTALPALAGTITDPTTFAVAPPGTDLHKTTYGNVAPRIGIAYQLSQQPEWSTVLRGGFGTFYDLGGGYLGTVSSGAPFFAQSSLFGVAFPPTGQETPPTLSLDPPISNFTGADPNLKLPRTYQWNVGVEQSIGGHQSLSATYLGAAGRNLLHEEQYFAPNATFGGLIFLTTNAASSDYHALQLQFKRSLAKGLQALASYTWSHSIDNASDDSNRAFVGIPLGSAGYNPRADRGPSDFDIRHSGSVAISYDIPRTSFGSAGSAILNGWALDTLLLARSAPPADLIGAFGFAPPLFGNLRPDVVPGQPFYLSGNFPGGKAFNPAAFVRPQGTQGTLPRNALRAFGAWQEDLAVRRTFKLSEKLTLQFRAEAFNLFNHPNFAPPANNISSAFFGRSVQMLNHSLGGGGIAGGASPLYQIGGPRSTQFALKLQF